MTFTLYSFLTKKTNKFKNQCAIIDGANSLSYSELYRSVNIQINRLRLLGVSKGSRVAIHLPKSIEEVISFFAISSLGAISVNINYQLSFHQVSHILNDAECMILITDSNKINRSNSLIQQVKSVIAIGERTPERCISWIPDIINDNVSVDKTISKDIAALLYTSGSTGSPKGVMVTHRNLIDGAIIVGNYLKLNNEDRILSVPPFNFDYGLNQLLVAIDQGAQIVLQRVPLSTEILHSIQAYKITVLPLVAPSWVEFLKLLQNKDDTNLETLRVATNTGGKIPQNLLKLVPSLLPNTNFFLMYGLTEAFRSTYLPPELFNTKMGAIGKAVPDNEVFVVDQEKGICGINEIGELIHRGCFVSRGYWKKPNLTSEKIHSNPHLKHICGDELLVHSGDLVRMDEDGILWFEGRMDEMIKCSGYRLSPTEVEEILSKQEGIDENVCFGIENEELGQVVHAAVVTNGTKINEKSIIAFCKKSMPSYMIPRVVHLRSSNFPRTANGKIDRVKVINQFKKHL